MYLIIVSLLLYLVCFVYTRVASKKSGKAQSAENTQSDGNGDNVSDDKESRLKFYRCSKFPVNKVTQQIFSKEGILKVNSPEDANIYIPCGYNDVEKEYKTIPKSEFIYAIKGCDSIVAKNKLWEILESYYGRAVASILVPETYLLSSQEDRLRLLGNPIDKIFIAKKNLQRQEGILLIKKQDLTIKKLNEMKSNKFVVVQEYLKNPFTINGHKINIRVYLLLVIKNNKLSGYTYDDGFIYYTKEKYTYSTDKNAGITTGYIDRSMYETNPLTHKDLDNYLLSKGYQPSVLYENMETVIAKVIRAFENKLSGTATKCNYQLFGIDMQPDDNLGAKLIEINKGPSLQPMDSRDRSVKRKLQEDMYNTIGVIQASRSTNGFKKIY